MTYNKYIEIYNKNIIKHTSVHHAISRNIVNRTMDSKYLILISPSY